MDYSYGNNYNTGYGAQGAADGGGFVSGDGGSSQQGGSKHNKDTVRPVTVKQILDASQAHPDAEWKIDGSAINQVTFVGKVRDIQSQTTNVTYKIDDGSGIVEVKQWIGTEAAQDEMDVDVKQRPSEDTYCRVYGQLKAFNNKRHIGAHVIRPVTDLDEVHYHLLEATYVHLFFTRGPPPTEQSNGTTGQNNVNGGQQDTSSTGRNLSNLTPTARKVYMHLREMPQTNEGLHVQLIASNLGMGVNDVYKGAEELVSQGMIFPTVDDNTWAVLDY